RRLSRDGDARERHTGARPEVDDVSAGVVWPLVEPDGGDFTGDVVAELDANLDGVRIARIQVGGHRREAPEAAGAVGPLRGERPREVGAHWIARGVLYPSLHRSRVRRREAEWVAGHERSRLRSGVVAYRPGDQRIRRIPQLEGRRPDTRRIHGL